jgi:hypothetical protein
VISLLVGAGQVCLACRDNCGSPVLDSAWRPRNTGATVLFLPFGAPHRHTIRRSSQNGASPETHWPLTKPPPRVLLERLQNTGHANAPPLCRTDRGSWVGDFVKVDCAACHHVALLTPEALLRQGRRPAAKVLDLKAQLRCRGCGRKGRAVVSVKWRGQGG